MAVSMDFVAEALSHLGAGRFVDAQQILLRGLSQDPLNPRARALLARAFYEQGFLPFAIRELEQVHQEVPNNQYVRSLLERLAPERVLSKAAVAGASGETIAEADFDIGEIEILDKG